MSTRQALLVIDVQNDFITGSMALPVTSQGKAPLNVVAIINRLMNLSPSPFDLIVFSQDWHPPNHISFNKSTLDKSQNSTIEKWPQHCVQGTWGADLHAELNITAKDPRTKILFVKKGTNPYTDGYSAFGPDTNLETILQQTQIDHVYVVGLALDYCVKLSALDAAKIGFHTSIILDACHAVDENCLSSYLADVFKKAGIKVISSLSISKAMDNITV